MSAIGDRVRAAEKARTRALYEDNEAKWLAFSESLPYLLDDPGTCGPKHDLRIDPFIPSHSYSSLRCIDCGFVAKAVDADGHPLPKMPAERYAGRVRRDLPAWIADLAERRERGEI